MPWHPDIDRISAAVECAPSIFDRRPWEVRLDADDKDRVNLYAAPDADLRTWLPREVVISCGAALYNMRLAIRAAGHTPSVWVVSMIDQGWLTDGLPAEPTLLASVEVLAGRPTPTTAGVEELYEAMWLRHTDRWPHDIVPVPLPLLVEMENAAAEEHGWLRVLHPREQRLFLREVARVNERLTEVPFTGSGPAGSPDEQRLKEFGSARGRMNKVPDSAHGLKSAYIRPEFWRPGRTASFGRNSRLMALSTDDDRALDWLRAGQALQHALLTGTRYSMSARPGRGDRYRVSLKYGTVDSRRLQPRRRTLDGYGVTASFLTQSLELDDVRHQARRWPWHWFYPEVPQMVLRVGFGLLERAAAPPRNGTDSTEPPSAPPDTGDRRTG